MKEKALVHWGYFFTTMSLEKGRQFWGDMGLTVSSSTADEIHRLSANTLKPFFGQATSLTELSETDGGRRSVMEKYLRELTRRLTAVDELESAIVSKWIACTFLGVGEYAYEDLWRSTLLDIYWKLKRKEDLYVALQDNEEEFRAVVDRFASEINRISEESDRLAQQTFEGLDRQIFKYYDIYSPDEYKNKTTPYDIIFFTCTCAKFRQLWSQLTEAGARDLMDLFYQCFGSFAHEKKIASARPELIHPPEMGSW